MSTFLPSISPSSAPLPSSTSTTVSVHHNTLLPLSSSFPPHTPTNTNQQT
jgi:hypothetical protein